MRKLSPTAIAAIILGVLVVFLLGFLLLGGRSGNSDRLTDDQVAGGAVDDPEKMCADQATFDRIKRELFRRAGQLRGSDQAALEQIGSSASLRVDAPMMRRQDKELGSVECSADIALDLPPGVAVVGGRRTLLASITYALQPAADGSGTVLTLSGADTIVTPLATLARTDAEPTDDVTDNAVTPDDSVPEDPLAPEPGKSDEPAVSARPSFDCDDARTRGETAVCADNGLAALDRNMAAQYNRAIGNASPEQRAILRQTRDRFLAFRDQCGSRSCIGDAYVGRMREIRDIMEGRWQPPR